MAELYKGGGTFLMVEFEARSRGGWGAVIVLGHRAGGGFQGVSP